MIIKEAISPAPSVSKSDAIPPTPLSSTRKAYFGSVKHKRTKPNKCVDYVKDKEPLLLSRPSTAASGRSYSVSRVDLGGVRTTSRPVSAISVRSSSSSRAHGERERRGAQGDRERRGVREDRDRRGSVYAQESGRSRPVRRYSSYSLHPDTSASVPSKPKSPDPEEDTYRPIQNIKPVEDRPLTSKDVVMNLFNAWQPQLCDSYRPNVEFVPMSSIQFKCFMKGQVPLRSPSPYLEHFRTVSRVAETLSFLHTSSRCSNITENMDGGVVSPIPGLSRPPSGKSRPPSASESVISPLPSPTWSDGHLPRIPPGQRPRSGGYAPTARQAMINSGQRLEKTMSVQQFNL